jgi:ABC-2 type transport system ATP-binding protein
VELKINKLTKQYGNKLAVDRFSATFTEGINGLLGANGSGKTTLMRMMCDILRPTSGEVLLDGVSISTLGEDYRELLGYLPQNFGYYPDFTAWDFMMYLSSLKGLPKLTAKNRCKDLLEMAGLCTERNEFMPNNYGSEVGICRERNKLTPNKYGSVAGLCTGGLRPPAG